MFSFSDLKKICLPTKITQKMHLTKVSWTFLTVVFSFIVIIFTMCIFVGVISCVCAVPGLSDCLSLIRLTFAAVCVLALFACLYFSDLVSALVEWSRLLPSSCCIWTLFWSENIRLKRVENHSQGKGNCYVFMLWNKPSNNYKTISFSFMTGSACSLRSW